MQPSETTPGSVDCPYSVRLGVGAGSPSADTSQQGRGQATRSPPTGHTHPPSRQNGSSVAGAQSSSPWPRTPAAAPSDPQPRASCLAGNRDWEPPTPEEGRASKVSKATQFIGVSRSDEKKAKSRTYGGRVTVIPKDLCITFFFSLGHSCFQ